MRKRLVQLHGTKQEHKTDADWAMRLVRKHLSRATEALNEGSCTVAYINILDMWHALGRVASNSHWAGGTPFEPTSEIENMAQEFTTRCLRDEPVSHSLAGRHRRRKKARR